MPMPYSEFSCFHIEQLRVDQERAAHESAVMERIVNKYHLVGEERAVLETEIDRKDKRHDQLGDEIGRWQRGVYEG